MTDFAGGVTLYGEGLWSNKDKSWNGILDENGLRKIPFNKYRFIESVTKVEKGMVPMPHPGLFRTYHEKTGLPENISKKKLFPVSSMGSGPKPVIVNYSKHFYL
jgi:hypothetical protein